MSGRIAIVADRDQIIAVAGGGKSFLGKTITKDLEAKMEKRENILAGKGDRVFFPIVDEMPEEVIYEAICPILSEGDMIGAVILLETDTLVHLQNKNVQKKDCFSSTKNIRYKSIFPK